MNNLSKIIGAILFLTFAVSCSQNLESENLCENTDNAKFESLKVLSKKHSEGLDYIYDQLLSQKESNARNSGIPLQVNRKDITRLAVDYVYFDKTLSKYLSNVSKLETRASVDEEYTETQINLSDDAVTLLYSCLEYFYKTKSYAEFESFIENAIKSTEYKNLDTSEQEILYFSLQVALDSSLYWKDNIYKWDALVSDRDASLTKGIAGPPAYYWTENMSEIQMQRAGHIIISDAVGCVISVIPSGFSIAWVIGGVVGSAMSLWPAP